MQRLHSHFIEIAVLLFLCGTVRAEEDLLIPIFNKGLLLIEKEMIRVSEQLRTAKSPKAQKEYKALLFLEDYFLNGGINRRSMKIVHQIINMRETAEDLRQKAFLDCEAWRVLDHDLKNYTKKELIERLKAKRKFTKEDHLRFRRYVSNKVSTCIRHISNEWVWMGPAYQDIPLDVKARSAVDSVKATYVILKNSDRLPASDSYEDILAD